MLAQPIECVAHRRLAQSNAAARAGDAALLHHRIEHDQQIEIEGTPIHSKHVWVTRMHFKHGRRRPTFSEADSGPRQPEGDSI